MANDGIGVLRVFVLLMFSLTANGDRISKGMYENIHGGTFCYRRLNGTHEIGCTSKNGGSVGIIHIVKDYSDVDWLLQKAEAGPYMAVLSMEMFTKDVMDQFIERADVISGLIVINNRTIRPESYSHEMRCPNVNSQAPWEALRCEEGASDSQVWNPQGTGLMYRRYPFPIYYLPRDKTEDIESIYKCFDKFNSNLEGQKKRMLCAVEMNTFMYAASNSEVCYRRSNMMRNLSPSKYCDPLGDRSIYMTLFPRAPYKEAASDFSGNDNTVKVRQPVKEGPKSVMLLTAAMDGTSFFEGDGINAISSVSSFVILLATAELLKRMFPIDHENDYDKNVLMMLLNGESYDLVGSQRFAWDLSRGAFPNPDFYPLDPNSLGVHLHIGQVHGLKGAQLNAFTPDYQETERNQMVDEFVSWMKDSEQNVQPQIKRGGRIPSSSIHSLLRAFNSSQSGVASALLADHGESFSNRFYHSVLDDREYFGYKYINLNLTEQTRQGALPDVYPDDQIPTDTIQSRLANISTSVGRAIYKYVTGATYNGTLQASPFLVDELLHCHLDTVSCWLVSLCLSRVDSSDQLPPSPLYVGVVGWSTVHFITLSQLAALFSGTQVNRTGANCTSTQNDLVNYIWMPCSDLKGCCIRSNLNYVPATSPAFEIPGYDFASGQFSTWAESVWNHMYIRLLVRPARAHETLALALGMSAALLSIFVVLLCQRHISTIFDSAGEGSSDGTTNETEESHVDC